MEAKVAIHGPRDHYPIKMVVWKVKEGDTVEKDQILGIYEHEQTETHVQENGEKSVLKSSVKTELRSFFAGKVDKIAVQTGRVCSGPQQPLGYIIEPCSHAVQLHGLCALCGRDLTIGDYLGTDTHRATINMTHDARGVTISRNEAARLEHERAQMLIQDRKLSLLLDLDQTVIHATVDPTVGEWMKDSGNPNYPALHEVYSFVLPESPIVYYIKLRPKTREFLEKMQEYFELHIYTMGSRTYAHAVANILDPEKTIFKDRILSRDDSGSFTVKSIQRLFPCDQSMVVVIDDRADVWQWSPNLLKVRPYDFFVGIGDINEPSKISQEAHVPLPAAKPVLPSPAVTPPLDNSPDTTDSDTESEEEEKKAAYLATIEDAQQTALHQQETEKPLLKSQQEADQGKKKRPVLVDNDRDLVDLQAILVKLHTQFYGLHDQEEQADVRILLPALKYGILRDCTIAFSGVIPIGTDPQSHELWRMALMFGASCQQDIDASVTHVVASKMGTAKVKHASKFTHIWIISTDWLYDCATKFKRVDEELYLLDPSMIPISKPVKIDVAEEVAAKIGQDDWKAMDAEIEEFMGESSDEDDWDLEIEDELKKVEEEELSPVLGKRKQSD
ncbi:RNA polymerase II subunit A C-terminal domain phosphatase [Gorgonomyces haynaldii]|nr:RNA polymerase II subunit A C-terminal domain phosphatase [Gorgonomyces haynaldii]